MFTAVRDDFAALPGVEVVGLAESGGDEESAFRNLATTCDSTLVIAPEFDELLLTRCRWVLEAGGWLIGPTLDAIKLAADKWALAEHLCAHGIRTPKCWKPGFAAAPPPWVCKPRFGAGSLATCVIRDEAQLPKFLEVSQKEDWHGEHIIQPFVPGLSVSVAFLIGPLSSVALAPTAQDLSSDGRLQYRGGYLPLSSPLADRAVQLAQSAIRCVPGLLGYVGVDLVLGDAADGSKDWVIEINPRLTTSYIGLRELAKRNLADAMLRIEFGDSIQSIEWNTGVVRFSADGTIHRSS